MTSDVVVLGTLGGAYTAIQSINNAGQVVGTSMTSANLGHAFVWSPGSGMKDLGTLGGTSSEAFDINNAGQIVGDSKITGDVAVHAFLWTPGVGMIDLGTLGGTASSARAINDAGQVVGFSSNAGAWTHAFLWTPGLRMQDLGTLGGGLSDAYDINNAGQIVGESQFSADHWFHAFLWTPGVGMKDLGTLGGGFSTAKAINDAGQIVGYSITAPPSGATEAFLWTAGAGMRDLGNLGGSGSYGTSINSAGQIVGFGHTTTDKIYAHLFLWTQADGMEDLHLSDYADVIRVNDDLQVAFGNRVARLYYAPGQPPFPTVHLVGAGDIANCSSPYPPQTANVVASYLADYPDAAVFTLGDNVQANATAEDYANCYTPTWGRFKTTTHPAIGDAEYALGDATPTFDYFGDLLGPRDLGYYSYDLGGWHVVVLNSNGGYVPDWGGSAQETWLKNDLATTTKPCILAYWHYPRFLSRSSGSSAPPSGMRQVWIDLYKAGATLVLNGDAHRYERFALQDPDGNPTSHGIREIIVGTGGDWAGPQPTVIAANSEVRQAGTYGVLALELGSGWYRWSYMPVPGKSFTDVGTGSCVSRSTATR